MCISNYSLHYRQAEALSEALRAHCSCFSSVPRHEPPLSLSLSLSASLPLCLRASLPLRLSPFLPLSLLTAWRIRGIAQRAVCLQTLFAIRSCTLMSLTPSGSYEPGMKPPKSQKVKGSPPGKFDMLFKVSQEKMRAYVEDASQNPVDGPFPVQGSLGHHREPPAPEAAGASEQKHMP